MEVEESIRHKWVKVDNSAKIGFTPFWKEVYI